MRRFYKNCGAYARSTGLSCKAMGLANGRCRNHGGLSTGPKTQEGRDAVASATAKRMASGQKKLAMEGFRRWFDAGGQQILKNLATYKAKKSVDKRMVSFVKSSMAITYRRKKWQK